MAPVASSESAPSDVAEGASSSSSSTKLSLSPAAVAGFSPAAIAAIRSHSWPGNVRELSHVIETAVVLGDGPLVELTSPRARSGGTSRTTDSR
jgi:DNA-binding NtrC family response regulator